MRLIAAWARWATFSRRRGKGWYRRARNDAPAAIWWPPAAPTRPAATTSAAATPRWASDETDPAHASAATPVPVTPIGWDWTPADRRRPASSDR